jgi:hypothetical protein
VLERDGQCTPDRLETAREVASLGERDALQAARPQPQIEPVSAIRILGGRLRELDRGGVARLRAHVVAHRQPLDGRVGGSAPACERVRGGAPCGERRGAVAPEVADGREAPLGLGERRGRVGVRPERADLAPGEGGIRKLAAQLRAARVRLERLDTPFSVLALGPELERLAPRVSRVAVGVHRPRVGGRPQQRLAGAHVLTGAHPMGRDLGRAGTRRLECLGEAAVKRASVDPRDVRVERLARERMPEAAGTRRGLGHEPAVDHLGETGGARGAGHEVHVERLARHGRRVGGRARLAGQLGGADQDGVPDARGERHLLRLRQLEPAPSLAQRARHPQRAGELLDVERQALRAVVDGAHERGRRRGGEHSYQQLARLVLVERVEHDLVESPASSQLVPEPAQHVVAREAVGPVGRDHEQGQPADRLRERRQEVERGLVGPLEVVEHDQRAVLGHAREGRMHGLEQRRAVAHGGGLPDLGQDQRKVIPKRPEGRQAARPFAQVRAQDGGDRAVRSTPALRRPAPQRGLP